MLTNLSSKHLRVTWQQTIQAGRPLAPLVSSVLWLQSPQTADIPVLMMKTNVNCRKILILNKSVSLSSSYCIPGKPLYIH